jgi:hypothetical protein
MSFGHAWTEYHDGAHWQRADASNIEASAGKMLYVPFQILSDEGPGFARAILDGLWITDVQSVRVPKTFNPMRSP